MIRDMDFVSLCKYMAAFVPYDFNCNTLHRWMACCRILLAARLLQTTEHSLSDIVLICGFHSKSHLIATFRRYFGTTPSCYRVMMKSKNHSEE